METALFGLALIIAGWIIQLSHAWKGKREIHPWFIIVYAAGVFILVLDGYMAGMIKLALFNLISMLAAVFVLIKIRMLK